MVQSVRLVGVLGDEPTTQVLGKRRAAFMQLAWDRPLAVLGALRRVDDTRDAVMIVHLDEATLRRPFAQEAPPARSNAASCACSTELERVAQLLVVRRVSRCSRPRHLHLRARARVGGVAVAASYLTITKPSDEGLERCPAAFVAPMMS